MFVMMVVTGIKLLQGDGAVGRNDITDSVSLSAVELFATLVNIGKTIQDQLPDGEFFTETWEISECFSRTVISFNIQVDA